ncbi:hypothetical protein B0E53_00430 [Micromonospora sp. MH33]|uniref:hypothetical protein n=1 Tax=Micromonospora sp. MH33 TaxID=1945509 RepID=UPI000D14A632|nr:hypothetical protein [Micromonospora sp. MH33]PSK67620.1 hypothetical protein B0E53_00430 [Micromonospora sp. MH33]
MTAQAAADEPGDETEPTEPGSIQYRGADGEWHEITVEPKRTGDPELDAIWEMSLEELEKLVEDESHPLHEKAKQVSAEIMKPIAEAFGDIMKPLRESLGKSIGTSGLALKFDSKALFPALDASSWSAKLVPELPKAEVSEGLGDQRAASARMKPPPALTTPAQHWVDFEAIEPPNASLAEIQEAAEARAHELRSKQIEVLTALLVETRAGAESDKEALDISKQALKATKSSKRAGWIAAWAAIAAAVISIAGILVTVLLTG